MALQIHLRNRSCVARMCWSAIINYKFINYFLGEIKLKKEGAPKNTLETANNSHAGKTLEYTRPSTRQNTLKSSSLNSYVLVCFARLSDPVCSSVF